MMTDKEHMSLVPGLRKTEQITSHFLIGLNFIIADTARDPEFFKTHLLAYFAQDLLQSAVSIPHLCNEGMQNVARRELRFVLEGAIKLCVIQQADYQSSVDQKLDKFEALLDSSSISGKNAIDLSLLPDVLRKEFLDVLGRMYGELCSYVHLTQVQLQERVTAVRAGQTAGFETAADVDLFNSVLERTLAAALVLLLHSVPQYVGGDLLADKSGSSPDWHFMQSKYIAGVDESYDYKYERQGALEEIKRIRLERIRF